MEHAMNRSSTILAVGATLALFCAGLAADEAERQMNVSQGPELVFAMPLGEIFPELADALATDENGRVGNELVFWGYRLSDGRQAFLVACAMIEDVDCQARETRVCPGLSQSLGRTTTQGLVRNMRCQAIGMAAPGELHPGCTDNESSQALAVSLLVCQ
jgi:hypothetical protein